MAGKGTKVESESTKPHEHVTFKIKKRANHKGKRDRKNPEKENTEEHEGKTRK